VKFPVVSYGICCLLREVIPAMAVLVPQVKRNDQAQIRGVGERWLRLRQSESH
jgi:hypothetical protein